MRNVKVMVPSSKREQGKIASILASLDERIENNQQINNNILFINKFKEGEFMSKCNGSISTKNVVKIRIIKKV